MASVVALERWNRDFSSRHLTLTAQETSPFRSGKLLGSGGVGAVFETNLGGVKLALKKTYTKRLSKTQLNEIHILRQLSERENRHVHVVELIGSYVHYQKASSIELGVLMWPAAHCDLSSFLHDVDMLGDALSCMSGTAMERPTDEEVRAFASLTTLIPRESEKAQGSIEQTTISDMQDVYKAAIRRLCGTYGCIAGAVRYLHQHHIRHKDLKPSQILLSPDGVWLTDFGWAVDYSELSGSATSNGGTTTRRYHAPERARGDPCGSPEDIFALGCTYLEMGLRVVGMCSDAHLNPDAVKTWSFNDCIGELHRWTQPLKEQRSTQLWWLAALVETMLSQEAVYRPSVDSVANTLSSITDMTGPADTEYRFHGPCCRTKQEMQAIEYERIVTSCRAEQERAATLEVRKRCLEQENANIRKDAENDRNNLKARLANTIAGYEALQMEKMEIEEHFKTIEEEIKSKEQTLRTQVSLTVRGARDLDAENIALKADLREQKRRVEVVSAENGSLMQEMDRLKEGNEEERLIRQEEIQYADQRIECLEITNRGLRDDMENQAKEAEGRIEDQASRWKAVRNELLAVSDQLNTSISEKKTLEFRCREATRNQQEKQVELDKNQRQISNLELSCKAVQKRAERQTEQVEALTAEKRQLEEHIEELETELENLETGLQRAHDANVKEIRKVTAEARKEIMSREREMEALRESVMVWKPTPASPSSLEGRFDAYSSDGTHRNSRRSTDTARSREDRQSGEWGRMANTSLRRQPSGRSMRRKKSWTGRIFGPK